MGHNLCLDIFGGPSDAEAAAGLPVHGEASVGRYEIEQSSRHPRPARDAAAREPARRAANRSSTTGWCASRRAWRTCRAWIAPSVGPQHVTARPAVSPERRDRVPRVGVALEGVRAPFGQRRLSRARRRVHWPRRPRTGGGTADLRRSSAAAASSAYTAHLMDPRREHGVFRRIFARGRLAFGYVWQRADFPGWASGRRTPAGPSRPGTASTLTRGMEFGVSPFPESRREMIDRGRLFDVPTFRWIPAATPRDGRLRDCHAARGRGPGNTRLAA